jgi:hypothetical protein
MIGNHYRRLANGGIDYDHYRHRARRMRRASRRRAGRHCVRAIRPLIAAVVIVAALIVIPANTAGCISPQCSATIIAAIATGRLC